MVIGAVNQNDFGWTPAESLACGEAAKTSTNDNHTWQMLIHRHKN